jgi:hypothetical protein
MRLISKHVKHGWICPMLRRVRRCDRRLFRYRLVPFATRPAHQMDLFIGVTDASRRKSA